MTDFPSRVLVDAKDRLRAWIKLGDYDSPTPVADVLNALYMLEERWRAAKGNQQYFAERAAHRAGPTTAGLMFVRGRLVHSGGESVSVIIGSRPFTLGMSTLGGGDALGGPGVTVVWRSLADLPTTSRPETHGRDVDYGHAVAGRDVLTTVTDADTFFESL